MRIAVINIEGKTDSDIELALEEILRLIKKDFTSGLDINDSGSFDYGIRGEEELNEDL